MLVAVDVPEAAQLPTPTAHYEAIYLGRTYPPGDWPLPAVGAPDNSQAGAFAEGDFRRASPNQAFSLPLLPAMSQLPFRC